MANILRYCFYLVYNFMFFFFIQRSESRILQNGGGRLSRDLITSNALSNTNITTGVGGGFYKMKSGQVIEIKSSNYGVDNYFHGDATVWRFYGTDCGVSALCPCFDIPSSLKCFGDYLKISDIPFYEQRFCGDGRPNGIYRSSSGHLRIRFRTDIAESGRGFLCYVSCTAAGKADPPLPSPLCFRTTTTMTLQPNVPICPPPVGSSTDMEVVPDPPLVGTICTPPASKRGTYNKETNSEQKVNWIPIAGRSEINL